MRSYSPARSIARCVTRTSDSDVVTIRVYSGDATDGSGLCFAPLQRLSAVSATIQNFPNSPSHTLKSEFVGQHAFEKGQ